jgi:hypothetical protein
LTRAARDFATERPDFAVASGLAALHWISQGAGYDITGTDVLDAYTAVMQAAAGSEMGEHGVNEQLRQLVDGSGPYCKFLKTTLVHHLPT